MDTWHVLEQRFNEIANRDHTVTMFYRRMDGDQLYVRFQGPVPKDRFRFLAVRDELAAFRESGGLLPADLSGDSHTVSELTELIIRAGQLVDIPGDQFDRMDYLILELIRAFEVTYGSAEDESDGCKYFANAARVFGYLCGKFASRTASVVMPDNQSSIDWHPVKIQAKEYKKLLEKTEGSICANTVTARIDHEIKRNRIRRRTEKAKLEIREDLWKELNVNP